MEPTAASLHPLLGTRCAAGALCFDAMHTLLLVKAAYPADWTIPGGNCAALGSLTTCARREVREEPGLDLPIDLLLCVGYRRTIEKEDDRMQPLFHGGTLTDTEIACIARPPNERSAWQFVEPHDAPHMVGPVLARQLQARFEDGVDGGTASLKEEQRPAMT